MSEWWTYELSNFLLFSPRTYTRLVEGCNRELWPLHVPLLLSGLAAIVLGARGRGRRDSAIVASILGAASLWVAWAFHLQRYAPINWAARWFALAFAIQGILLVANELPRRQEPSPPPPPIRLSGLAVAAVAVLVLPLVERLLGRPWAQVETFGLFPDATALATIGLLLARPRVDVHLVAIPLLWCVVGAATRAALELPDAVAMAAATGAAALVLAWKTALALRSRSTRTGG